MTSDTKHAAPAARPIRLLSASELDAVTGGNKGTLYKLPNGSIVEVGCTQKPPKGAVPVTSSMTS
jgi:hypothetical protein